MVFLRRIFFGWDGLVLFILKEKIFGLMKLNLILFGIGEKLSKLRRKFKVFLMEISGYLLLVVFLV